MEDYLRTLGAAALLLTFIYGLSLGIWKSLLHKQITRTVILASALISVLVVVAFTIIYFSLQGGIWTGKEVEQKFKDRQASGATEIAERKDPEGYPKIRSLPYRGQSEYYSDHVFWLEQEGDRDKTVGLIASYIVCEAQYQAPYSTKVAKLILRVPEGYTLWSRIAMRQTNLKGRVCFERLQVISEGTDRRSLNIHIPECERDDKITILFRLSSKTEPKAPEAELIIAKFEKQG